MTAFLRLAFSLCFFGVRLQASIRLVSQDGRTSFINGGRLEVYLNGQWGTVCDDNFGYNDAIVACRQLGYSGLTGYDSARDLGYSAPNGPIWLDNLSCSPYTSVTLASCGHNGVGIHDCSHNEDIILSCHQVTRTSLTFYASGRLEILYRNTWGTVCADGFNTISANVACRQMGFSNAFSWTTIQAQSLFSSAFSKTPTWLDEVRCVGSALDYTRLANCPHNVFGTEDCVHSQDVVLYCNTAIMIHVTSSSELILDEFAGLLEISSSASIGVLVGGSLYVFFLCCCPILICIMVACCSSSSRRHRRVRNAPRPSAVGAAATTAATAAYPQQTQYPGYSITPQQPPSPRSISGISKVSSPPAYNATADSSYPVVNMQYGPNPPQRQPPQAYPPQYQTPQAYPPHHQLPPQAYCPPPQTPQAYPSKPQTPEAYVSSTTQDSRSLSTKTSDPRYSSTTPDL